VDIASKFQKIVQKGASTFTQMSSLIKNEVKNVAEYFKTISILIRRLLGAIQKGKAEFIKMLHKFLDDFWKAVRKYFGVVDEVFEKYFLYFSKETEKDALFRDITKKFLISTKGIVTEEQFLKIAEMIYKAFKVEMILINRGSEKYAKLFQKWYDNPIYAVFHDSKFLNGRYKEILDGPKIYFFEGLSKYGKFELTAYTIQHELIHLRLWYRMNRQYPEMAVLYKKIPRVLDELNVIGEILKQNARKIGKWDMDDIMNDLINLNDKSEWKTFLKKHFGKENIELKDLENWDITKYLKHL
jgi:hypothetical protein